MAGKKRSSTPSESGPVLVILEEIRSQNRATLEAVEAHRGEFRREIQELRSATRADVDVLKSAARELVSDVAVLGSALQGVAADLQQLKTDLAGLREQVARTDAVITADYRERLERLERRIEAIERRSV